MKKKSKTKITGIKKPDLKKIKSGLWKIWHNLDKKHDSIYSELLEILAHRRSSYIDHDIDLSLAALAKSLQKSIHDIYRAKTKIEVEIEKLHTEIGKDSELGAVYE